MGGAFQVTKGLQKKYGTKRVRNTPISEAAIIGTAIGTACTGLKPIAEIMFCDFLYIGMNQLINQMAKIKYMYEGKACFAHRHPHNGRRRPLLCCTACTEQ